MVNHLVLNQRVHINDILEDPMFAVVFILEYVIGEQLSAEDRKVSVSLHHQTVLHLHFLLFTVRM